MTDYRKILMLRSKKCSQREMKRNKVASRETSKAVFCECYPNSWPQGLRPGPYVYNYALCSQYQQSFEE